MKESQDGKQLKVSFQAKDASICPLCGSSFRKEELLTGSGRLLAGALTDELHRLYDKSAKYGDLYPLAYQATVCPNCWFAAMDSDFTKLPKDIAQNAVLDEKVRKDTLKLIFPNADFAENRNLELGAASQMLVCYCYDYFPVEFSPTIKQGIASLRAGWLLDHLNEANPGQNYDWAATFFKKKAAFFYSEALAKEGTGEETLSGIVGFGPDTDKNYGYEGMLYLCGLLEYKYGSQEDPAKRLDILANAKRTIAKIFGLGKSSKSRPGPLLELGKKLYDLLGKELKDFDG